MHWGKKVVAWVAVELPKVITELGKEGPERVMDVMAERYREWLKLSGPRMASDGVPGLRSSEDEEPKRGRGRRRSE